MKRHASMNRVYRLIWSQTLGAWVCCAENAKGRGKSMSGRKLIAAALALMGGLFLTPLAMAGPTDGQVSAGAGTISQTGTNTTITQSTQNMAINWQSFNIAANESVRFIQPNAMSVALNRVVGQDPSQILGSLSANGQVFVVNPNGVLFGRSAQVNVGGLVATTLNLSDADFMAGNYRFSSPLPSGEGLGVRVINQGNLTAAQGGYIALLAPEVRNEGVISATLGTALLAAGDKVTLNLNNGSLLSYTIDQGALQALADNKQLIQADGGRVFMSAKAADALSSAVVNNTGIIQARTIQNIGGVIQLMGDMQVGTVNVGGTLDASAPSPLAPLPAGEGNHGGFIETSAAHVKVANNAHITTAAAANGLAGTWLIDPVDFTVAATGGDITGAALSTQLDTGNVIIQSVSGLTAGNGDIFVNDAINKTGTAVTSLTLQAQRNININSNILSTGGALNINLTPGAGGLGGTSGIYASVNTNGGVINFTNGITLSTFSMALPGSILNSTLTSTDALPTLFSAAGVLGGVTLGSNLSLGGYSIVSNNLALANGVTLNLGNSRLYFNSPGAQSINTLGAATINMAGGGIFQQYNQAQTLTLGTGLTVNGWGSVGENGNFTSLLGMSPFSIWTATAGNASLVSNGIINANTAGQTLRVGKFGNFTNMGSLNLSAGTLDLAGTVTTAGLGNFTRTAGTSVNLSGTLDNTGATVDIGSAGVFKTGGLTSLTGTILNGTLKNTDAAPVLVGSLLGGGATLDGVTLGSNLSTSYSLTVKNNLILADGVTLNLGNSRLYFNSPGAQRISTLGAATINMAGGGILQQYNQAQTLTLGTGLTVNGWGSVGESGNLASPFGMQLYSVWTSTAGNASFVNNGIINANSAGQMLRVGNFSNFTNTGIINLSAGTLDLAGKLTTAGLGNFTRTAGTSVVLSGTLDNTGATVDIGSAGLFKTGGLTRLSGTILNGTLKNTDAVPVLMSAMTPIVLVGTVPMGGGGTLDGVTLGSNLNLSASSNLTVKNNLILADGVTLNLGNSRLSFNTAGAQSISTLGAATINMAGGGLIQQPSNQIQTLTLGSGLTLNGGGTVGGLFTWSPTMANIGFVNNGVINANQWMLLGQNGNFTNNGTINGSNNSSVLLNGGGTHSGTFNFNSGAVLNLNNGVFHLTNANAITGNGMVRLGFGSTTAVTIDGAVSIGTLEAYGSSTSTLNGALNANNLLVNGGLNLNGTVAPIANLTIYGGGMLNSLGSLSCTRWYQHTPNGTLNVGGNLDLANTVNAGMTFGNVNVTGNLTASTIFIIGQWAGTHLAVGGTTTLSSGNGMVGTLSGYSDIVLANAGNNFVGAVNATGRNISLADSLGGLKLGNINVAGLQLTPITKGNFTATASNGAITQAAGSKITVTGDSTLTADNGVVGVGNIKSAISLANTGNNFMGAVNALGGGVNLLDSVGGLQLGNINSTSLTATSRGGAISQSAGSAVVVGGGSALTANNGIVGAANVQYGINLSNAGNNFANVNAKGNGINLNDLNALTVNLTDAGATTLNAAGALLVSGTTSGLTANTTGALSQISFGNLNVNGALNAKSGYVINQNSLANNPLKVTGVSTLNAASNINLSNVGNDFMGAVNATAGGVTKLTDVNALQANLNSTGAVILNAGGALSISGTAASTMNTNTTGSTTFGNTTVGTRLSVNSTGAVSRALPSTLLTVANASTKTPNTKVTVNGVVGALIP